MKIDMWYGDKLADADSLSCFFYDCDCEYRGNLYKNGKTIGDYTAKDTQSIEKAWTKSHKN